MIVFRMLAGAPKNGVELMDAIEEMTHGWWRPSPGSIYPVLEQLEDEKLVKKREDGKYELTKAAQDEMEWSSGPFGPPFRRPRSVDATILEVSGFVSYLEEALAADPSLAKEYKAKIRNLADRLSSLAK